MVDWINGDDDGGVVLLTNINNISLVIDTGYFKSPATNKSDAFL